MINKQELRLGNIFWENYGGYKIVTAIGMNKVGETPNSILGSSLSHNISGCYGLDDIVAVPLSPEILVSCGCKYGFVDGISCFDESTKEGITHYWDLSVKANEITEGIDISIVKWGDQEYFTFQIGKGSYRKKIKYLHDFQNIYFSLSGIELTINLK